MEVDDRGDFGEAFGDIEREPWNDRHGLPSRSR